MYVEKQACANAECSCPAPSGGDYCSDYCQDPSLPDQILYDQPLDKGEKLICLCGHGECGEASAQAKHAQHSSAS